MGWESSREDRVTRYEYMALQGNQASRPAILGLVQVVVTSESGVQNPGKLVSDPLDGVIACWTGQGEWNKNKIR